MGMLDIGSKHNFLEDLKGKAKQDLTNEILEDSSKYLKGTQIMELNKTLNHCFANYEIFVDQRVDTDENYIEKNKEILNSYIATKKLEGLSPRTLYAYRHNLKKLFIYLNKPIPNITTEDIRDYLQYYQSLNNCSNTVLDSLRRYFSSFFNWAHIERLIPTNPMKKIKKIKGSTKIKKPYTNEEIEQMRNLIFNKDYHVNGKIRNQAIFELLLSSGIRVGELVGLNRNDIDLINRTMVVFGKGAKERECYFSAKAQYCLMRYLNTRDDNNPALFISTHRHTRFSKNGVERMIRELGQACNVKAHPHKFRRTFATNLINKGVPIEQVKTLLGHSSIDTTMIYAQVNQEAVKFNHRRFIE